MAQSNVYSLNVVGYVNVVLNPHADVLIANPLDAGNNTVSNLFKVLEPLAGNDPNGNAFTVFTWNGNNFVPNQLDPFGGGWGNPTQSLPPGSGMFVFNPTATPVTNTFVGNVVQGASLTVSLPLGDSLVGSKVPQQANIADPASMNLVANPGDTIFYWNGNNFVGVHNDEFGGGWQDPGDVTIGPVNSATGPVLKVAQGIFYFNSNNNGSGGPAPTWVRNFTVQ